MDIAEIQVVYSIENSERISISQASDAYKILKKDWNMNTIDLQEEFKIILLNRANMVLGIHSHSKGGASGTIADPKLIFSVALKCNASSIIVAHNHPSRNLKPSASDEKITKKLKNGAELLDIKLLDHLIICKTGFYSFANENMI